MTKQDLTNLLKPLIRACIKEELTRPDGTLRQLVTEIADGLAQKQLKLITETIRATQPLSQAPVVYGPVKQQQTTNKTPDMRQMMQEARSLVGADEAEKNAYVDIDKTFGKVNPALREMLSETQQRTSPQELNDWEPPPPIEQIRGADGKIDMKHAGSLGPLRDVDPNDPGVDLEMLSRKLAEVSRNKKQ
jgi:hypothetical protein